METILQKLDKLRNEKKLSIFKLTELSGLSENTIYNWYNKGSKPSLEALEAVCNVLNVSLSYFFAENIQESISVQEEKLLQSFRAITPEQKELILQILNQFEKHSI